MAMERRTQQRWTRPAPGSDFTVVRYRADTLKTTVPGKENQMARLVGTSGIDQGAVIDVPDDAVDELKQADYEDAGQEVGEEQEQFGSVSEWGPHEDYTFAGGREAFLDGLESGGSSPGPAAQVAKPASAKKE